MTSPRPGAVETLLHEFVHVRAGHTLRHGIEFTRLENGLRERIGFAPLVVRHRHCYASKAFYDNVDGEAWGYTCACGFTTFHLIRRLDILAREEGR